MAIRWSLRLYIASKHQIYTATELQKKISKTTGVAISLAQLCKFIKRSPKMIRLETIEIICTALGCELGDFLSIGPRKMNPEKKKKLSYKNTPRTKIGVKNFPEPKDYKNG
jgi:DNA-binding Xre family transcriptional regulator